MALSLRCFLYAHQISHADLQKWVSKLSFARSVIFGKCAIAFIQPQYIWMLSAYSCSRISAGVAGILRRRARLLPPFRPRVFSIRPKFQDYITATDAPFKDGRGEIAAFLRRREGFPPNAAESFLACCEALACLLNPPRVHCGFSLLNFRQRVGNFRVETHPLKCNGDILYRQL